MKSSTVGIEVRNLIPQKPRLIFSYSSQLGADAPIPFAKLQPFEVQEKRRGDRVEIEIKIPKIRSFGETPGLLELARAISRKRARIASYIENDFEALRQVGANRRRRLFRLLLFVLIVRL